MVELSHFICEADYIEELLRTLNTLSIDVSESASQIARTIEILISNHISLKDNCSLDEKKIKNLENQDYVPTKVLYKILESLNISVNKNL